MTVEIAHQYKIRQEQAKKNKYDLFGVYGENLNLNLKDSSTCSISRNDAKKIILDYEWLGTMSNTTDHYGIYFDNVLGGVVCYGSSCSANHNCPKEFGIKPHQLWFLARGACVHWTPKGTASRLISKSLNLLKENNPEARVVLAYSDTDAGEIGTVYQATNWLYIGRGTHQTSNWYSPKTGRRFDERMLHNLKFKWNLTRKQVREKLLDEGWEVQPKAIKHKYCFLLGSKKETKPIMKRIKEKILPYPKRENTTSGSGLKGESSVFQIEGSGSIPETRSKSEVKSKLNRKAQHD